jgi:cytochrome P450
MFDSLEEIRLGPKLDSCRFLKAVIEETLRISPSLPGILSRQVQSGGLDVLDHHFPAGIELAVPVYALHHNEEYFPNSHKHIPERWLVEDTEKLKLAQAAFQPFSYGSRQCIGRRLAYIELYIFIARIVYLYDLKYLGQGREETWGPEEVEYKLIDHLAAARTGPIIQFTRRTDTLS